MPLVEKAYGFADRERKRPNTISTRFNLGSINKAFPQTAVQQLIAKGQLAMSESIGKLFPDYPNNDALSATVDQLLNHTGVIANFFGPAFDAAPKEKFRSSADYFNFVAPMPLTFAPGARRRYCNGCYIVLGAMIEKVSGDADAVRGLHPAERLRSGEHTRGRLVRRQRGGHRDGLAQFGRHAASEPLPRAARAEARRAAAMRPWPICCPSTAAVRSDKLVARTTTDPCGGQGGGIGIAGGAPGINAGLESAGEWTVIVVSKFDPPSAERVGPAIARRLIR